MYSLLRKFLFLLDPEFAHYFALNTLKCAYKLNLLKQQSYKLEEPIKLMGLNFPNRVGMAAGFDRNGQYVDTLASFGFGHIEIGTVTPAAIPGNPKPRLFRLVQEEALINRMGFANQGLAYTLLQLQKIKFKGILGINIGKNPRTPNDIAILDYKKCFQALAPSASYITLNISSPNTIGLRALQQAEQLSALLSAMKAEQALFAERKNKYVPLVIKLAPDLTDAEIKDIATVLLAQKIDGIIISNTTIARPIPPETRFSNETGGLSGRPLHALSLQLLQKLQTHLQGDIPIIACGGNMDATLAAEKLAAGASLLQIYTGFIYHGPRLIEALALL